MATKKTYLFLALMVCGVLVSCKKESASTFDLFKGLKVDFSKSLSANELYVELKATKTASGAIMSKITLTEVGKSNPSYTIDVPFANRYSYESGVIILKAENPSTTQYSVKVYDDLNNEITSSVTVTYPAGKLVVSEPKLISNDGENNLAEGEVVYLDYTVTSEDKDIKYIWLESFVGTSEPARVNIATLADNATDTHKFRGAIRLTPNRSGGMKYRLYVTDVANDYIGDGYTEVTATMDANFSLSANKYVYAPNVAPDSISLKTQPFTAKCFYSISRKQAYTYEEAKAISEDIDFGVYFTYNNAKGTYWVNVFNMADAVAGNPVIGLYDLSGWTKRDTRFSILLDGGIFNTALTSGASITAEAKKYAVLTNRKRVISVEAGKLLYFLTPEGKNGAILFNNINRDFNKQWYANIDLKVVK
ncbi:hypothetical protein [Pelobium manganitolerans]|uniref:hypothetical protein n=1 Tax=Pelobium manganitolerans TaxID=1842495 RepID=UPI003FA34B01